MALSLKILGETLDILVNDYNDYKVKIEDILKNIGAVDPTNLTISDIKDLQEILDSTSRIILALRDKDIDFETNFTNIDSQISTINTKLANLPISNHKHEIADVNELQEQLDAKAVKVDFNALKEAFDTHKHDISGITGLQEKLNTMSIIGHKHPWSEITDRPKSTIAEIDSAVLKSHEHPNSLVISGLEDGGGVLMYNGTPLGEVAYMSVSTVFDRDSLPLDIRKEGLMVLVIETESMYYLKGGVDNAFWTIFATGAGGATNASTLPASPTGGLKGLNVQSLIDELEANKANLIDVYSKAELESILENLQIDYATIDNTPDLSSLHSHDNKATLDLFSEFRGDLTWKGKTLGDLVTGIYDADRDGIIDVAATLKGLISTIADLNQLAGITGNVQSQLDALSSGTVFKGEYDTYQQMLDENPTPSAGHWVFIRIDETKNSAVDTQYYHDGTNWIYGGGTSKSPESTISTKGIIQLGGDLAHPESTASAPKLKATGVTPGLYKSANVTIGEDGRITNAEEGSIVFLNDKIVSKEEGWSSDKIDTELGKKADRTHTHDELHKANMIGRTELSETVNPSNNFVPTYNAILGKAEWKPQQGGKVFIGSKSIQGDYTLKGGSYITLLIDEVTKEITISSTYRENGGNVIPTGVEIVYSIEVPASSKRRFSVESGYNKVMLHTLQVKNTASVSSEVRLYNQASEGFVEYNSNPEIFISDIINIPIFDNDNSKMLHFEIENFGIESSMFTLRAKITNLL